MNSLYEKLEYVYLVLISPNPYDPQLQQALDCLMNFSLFTDNQKLQPLILNVANRVESEIQQSMFGNRIKYESFDKWGWFSSPERVPPIASETVIHFSISQKFKKGAQVGRSLFILSISPDIISKTLRLRVNYEI